MNTISSCEPYVWKRLVSFLLGKAREYRLPLLSSFLFGILAHGFAFSNKLINHDEAYSLFTKGATLSSGRWGLRLASGIFPDLSMPWIYGILSIAIMAVAVCFLIRTFSIKSRLLQVLVAGSILVFPSLSATMLYMYTVTSYAVSFLLAVMSVWMLPKGRKWILPALACAILSLGIYQAYIAFIASFLVLLLIQELLLGEDAAAVFRKGILYVLFLVVSLGAYYGLTQILIALEGSAFNNYASSKIQFSFSGILENVVVAYKYFLRCLLLQDWGLIPVRTSRVLHLLCFAASFILGLVWISRKENRGFLRFLLMAGLLLIFPLAVCCMYLFTTQDSIHTLVLYSYSSIYVLFAVILDVCVRIPRLEKTALIAGSISSHVLTGCMAVIIAMNIYVANAMYLNQYLRYENVYAFYSSLVADIKEDPNFTEGTKVALVGEYRLPWFYNEYFPFLANMEGSYNFKPDCHAKERFLEFFMAVPIPFASAEEISAIEDSAQFQEMAVYPYYGSSQMIGDVFVIRLS